MNERNDKNAMVKEKIQTKKKLRMLCSLPNALPLPMLHPSPHVPSLSPCSTPPNAPPSQCSSLPLLKKDLIQNERNDGKKGKNVWGGHEQPLFWLGRYLHTQQGATSNSNKSQLDTPPSFLYSPAPQNTLLVPTSGANLEVAAEPVGVRIWGPQMNKNAKYYTSCPRLLLYQTIFTVMQLTMERDPKMYNTHKPKRN